MKQFYLLCCLGGQFLSIATFAQDVHFSNILATSLQQNPAWVGAFESPYRVVGVHRSQWRTVPVNYQSSYLYY